MSQEFWNVFSGDDFNFFHQTLGVCISRWRSCFESYFGAVFFCRWEHVGTLKNISLTIPLFFLQIVSLGHVFRLLGQNQLWSLRDHWIKVYLETWVGWAPRTGPRIYVFFFSSMVDRKKFPIRIGLDRTRNQMAFHSMASFLLWRSLWAPTYTYLAKGPLSKSVKHDFFLRNTYTQNPQKFKG